MTNYWRSLIGLQYRKTLTTRAIKITITARRSYMYLIGRRFHIIPPPLSFFLPRSWPMICWCGKFGENPRLLSFSLCLRAQKADEAADMVFSRLFIFFVGYIFIFIYQIGSIINIEKTYSLPGTFL